MPGEYAAKKLEEKRQKFKWRQQKYVDLMRRKKGKAVDPLKGAPQAKGIVIEKVGRVQKQPHSGIIKCVRVQLLKNGITVTAHAPGDSAITYIDEHDEVLIEGLGGSQRGAVGSMWGVKYKVVKVNDISLEELRLGRKEKPKR